MTDFHELQAAAILDTYQSFSRASKSSGIPLSTLSKRISRLEDELGIKLFNRMSGSATLTLTTEGERLLPLIHKMLNTEHFMKSHLEQIKCPEAHQILVGSAPTLFDKGDGRIIAQFVHDNPGINVSVDVRPYNVVIRLLGEGILDCAFVLMHGDEHALMAMLETFSGGSLDSFFLRSSSIMYIAMSENDPLASSDEVSLNELKRRRFILAELNDHETAGQPTNAFFKILGVDGADYDISYENFINQSYVLDLVRLGIGILPQPFLPENQLPGIAFVPLKGWQTPISIMYVVRKFRLGSLAKFSAYVINASKSNKKTEE